MAAREEQLEAVKHVVEELHGTLEPIEHTLDEAEDIFSAPASYGTNVDKSADELRKVEVRFLLLCKTIQCKWFLFCTCAATYSEDLKKRHISIMEKWG